MATLEFILLAATAVLISAILDELLPRISMPLIQIALGVVIGVLSWSPISLDISPDIFLLLFIAPLLYYEARKTDRTALWRHRTSVLSLAIGLVVAIMLIVGFSLHLLIPSIPLAAAFALGAALGPTDAVAVSSMKKEVKLTRRENALLNGECLLNDASGVVAFQFAIAATVTGFYSWQTALVDFTVEFFGGIILGILFALMLQFIQQKVRDWGLESLTFFSLLDIMTPFVLYMLSVYIHVSGILAVVACGLVISSFADRRIGPDFSQLNIHQANIWKAISFILNGIVFVILGLELPAAFTTTWQQPYIDNGILVGIVLIMTAVIVLVRFVWLIVTERLHKNPVTGKRSRLTLKRVLSCIALTIGGPKGAVTLSIILSIPFTTGAGDPFPERDLIIFIASGVILCTLVLANFFLPMVSPTPKKSEVAIEFEESASLRIGILRNVMQRLGSEQRESNAAATQAVISMYNDRIQRIIAESDDLSIKQVEDMERNLKVHIVRHQMKYITYLLDNDKIEPATAYRLARRLAHYEQALTHHRSTRWMLRYALSRISTTIRVTFTLLREALPGVDPSAKDLAVRDLRVLVEKETIRYLEHKISAGDSKYPLEMLTEAIADHSTILRALSHTHPS
ncbi:MAG: sodium:proton antiporter, partial [Coriobacteriia bacterium]|nr:sodium:proton antiporter [Coriobacteriia bacterium]